MKAYPVAIITGASKGIGKACAIGLAQKGYRTVLVARTETTLQEVAHEIREQHIRNTEQTPLVYPLDVTDKDKVQRFVQDIVEQLGRIDVLINNAGLTIKGSLNMSVAEFEQLFKANLRAPFSFLKAVVPIMKQQQSGHIFNIASRAGKYGIAGSGGYVATKFGLVGLSESLYRELAQEGISVTAICPGWVNTEMAQYAGTPLSHEDMIQPKDVMKTIQWVLDLSPGACVKEIVIECHKSII
jgi:3-oxoacyl-[acyl-carrier protein] reductase